MYVQMPDDLINVDFEFHDPREDDYHSIKVPADVLLNSSRCCC